MHGPVKIKRALLAPLSTSWAWQKAVELPQLSTMQKPIHETKNFTINYKGNNVTSKLVELQTEDPIHVLTKVVLVEESGHKLTAAELAEILRMAAEKELERETHNVYSKIGKFCWQVEGLTFCWLQCDCSHFTTELRVGRVYWIQVALERNTRVVLGCVDPKLENIYSFVVT